MIIYEISRGPSEFYMLLSTLKEMKKHSVLMIYDVGSPLLSVI